jgi:hypothetical protein
VLPDEDGGDLPAHIYVRSIHNIVVERGWRHFRFAMGDTAVVEYQKGIEYGIYSPHDDCHTLEE